MDMKMDQIENSKENQQDGAGKNGKRGKPRKTCKGRKEVKKNGNNE